MPKEQRTFTREFKLEAVQFVQKSGKSQAQIARDLGIADSTLHHWRKEFAEAGDKAFPGSGHQTTQEEEVRRSVSRTGGDTTGARYPKKSARHLFAQPAAFVIPSLLSMVSSIRCPPCAACCK